MYIFDINFIIKFSVKGLKTMRLKNDVHICKQNMWKLIAVKLPIWNQFTYRVMKNRISCTG